MSSTPACCQKIRSRGSPRRRQTGVQRWPAPAVRGTATGSTWRTSTLGCGFDEHTVPHMRRDGALLKLASMLKRHATDSMPDFELLDQPATPALENVASELVASGYLDKHGKLTEKGEHEAYDED
ncbi:hypothetical protein C2845_PM01G11380 [Panicum miliaceum]|uniref:Uncharacterized protein n=1 Tax=Panicum miliaceum TaxID=4540 RepID=A0A3L6TLG4_PANMI|nr:hypothetical protein C2845_PM01G11380 [Panicum miliaceum]